MRQIRDVLTYLIEQRFSKHKTAQIVGIHRCTVIKYLDRFKQSGLTWPLPNDLDDATLERRLFPKEVVCGTFANDIDFAYIHAEMQKRGATLAVLYAEWLEQTISPKPISYSQYCKLYSGYKKSLRISMRRTEAPVRRVEKQPLKIFTGCRAAYGQVPARQRTNGQRSEWPTCCRVANRPYDHLAQ